MRKKWIVKTRSPCFSYFIVPLNIGFQTFISLPTSASVLGTLLVPKVFGFFLIYLFFHLYLDITDIIQLPLVAQMVKHLPTMRETQVQSLGWEDLLEKEMATHSSILAWKIPWTEEPGRLQSMRSQRVRQDWATSHSHSDIIRNSII